MQTRYDRAILLKEKLRKGPKMVAASWETLTPETAERQCRVWIETYILPDVEVLVPELRRIRLEGPR